MNEWQVLVVGAQQGDPGAFEQVVRRFENMAVGYGYSILGDFGQAEDAAQEAFLEAYFNLADLREPAAFPAWLRRIVFKQCDRITRKKRLPTVSLDATAEYADPEANPLEAFQRAQMHEAILSAVEALPEHERAAITLFYLSGHSMSEVGEFLEVPISTVKNRLHSARQRLKERMIDMVGETLQQHAPSGEMGKKVRRIIEGIGRIHWDSTTVLTFPGSVIALMRYLGEPQANEYVMGISGGAFKIFWVPPYAMCNCDLLIIGEEPVRRTFAALGYDYTMVMDYDPKDDPEAGRWGDFSSTAQPSVPKVGRGRRAHPKAWYQERIVKSIDAGLPVLAQGIVGPPECGIITGYDKGGDVLYGRSYFQEDQKNYFSEENWYENLYSIILLGKKGEMPAPRRVLADTLDWAISLARVPERKLYTGDGWGPENLYSGLAAYDQIIAALGRDEDYPAGDLATLTDRTYPLGNDGIYILYCKRADAATFLRGQAKLGLPGADALREAAALYDQEVTVVKMAAQLTPWSGSPDADKLALADPSRRREIARLMTEAKTLEERAVVQLEKARAAL